MLQLLYQALVVIGVLTLIVIVTVIVFSLDRNPPQATGEDASAETAETVETAETAAIEDLWDFNDPAASEARFRVALADAASRAVALELLTQIARAQGLQRRFDEAHATLDEVEREADAADDRVRIRLALERGRVFNSAGERQRTQPLFEQAWQAARSANEVALAVDAAHMLAIVAEGDDSLQWNRRGLDLAESSEDPGARRWIASLHNNIGWTHHDRGDFDAALHHFELALEARKQQDKPREVLIARWCIARCLRSLGRVEEALAEQEALHSEWETIGEADGYVHEELAECLLALGRADEAQQHRERARELNQRD